MTTGTVKRLRADNGEPCIGCRERLCRHANGTPHARPERELKLSRGDRLEPAPGACMRFWTVIHGTAAICTSFEDGRRQILSLETDGDTICGLMSTTENANWLEALDDCQICEVDLSTARPDLREDPAFLSSVFAVTHRCLEERSRHVATLGRLDSTERVVLFLAEMARRQEPRLGLDRVVTLPMSREDIADYLGLNTETVIRIMSRLKKSGLVRFLSPSAYVVPDFAAIKRRLPVAIPDRKTSALFDRTFGARIMGESTA